ncbi:ParA family protein [Eisenibacter elegans]|jgi:cellulose biosynthesis protein BcsQ|uniref:ParA family protein n=1 Tax=Eisenibacter elegans TaxID=997 RepID=UPI0004157023|nr:AAA family ATPase [Eisenibacter elegans]
MAIFAVYNFKGGVGKTTAAVNLAYLAAKEAKTLLWDADPQGAASFYYQVKPKLKGGVKKLLNPKEDIEQFVKESNYPQLDLIPSDPSQREIDLVLDDLKKSEKKMQQMVNALHTKYTYVFIDCSPGLSLITEHIFLVADYILLPMIPTPLSLRTYQQVQAHFLQNNLTAYKLMPFFSQVDMRKKIHRDWLQTQQNDPQVLRTSIPYAADVEKMGIELAPLPSFAPRAAATKAFEQLWAEIKERI